MKTEKLASKMIKVIIILLSSPVLGRSVVAVLAVDAAVGVTEADVLADALGIVLAVVAAVEVAVVAAGVVAVVAGVVAAVLAVVDAEEAVSAGESTSSISGPPLSSAATFSAS
jgi:hypothetical protein